MSAAAGRNNARPKKLPPIVEILQGLTFSLKKKPGYPRMFTQTTTEMGKEVERDFLMLKARFADGSLFWRQPFYRSSGTASGFPGMWFPFLALRSDAIVKGDAVPSDWLENDRLYSAGELARDQNSPKRRILAYSFLVASNALNPIPDGFIRALRRELRFPELLDTVNINVLEGVERLDLEPAYKDRREGATNSEINAWIGTDIYLNYKREGHLITAEDRASDDYGKKPVDMAGAAGGAGASATGGRRKSHRRTQRRRQKRSRHRHHTVRRS
jgi:hypothetical protein